MTPVPAQIAITVHDGEHVEIRTTLPPSELVAALTAALVDAQRLRPAAERMHAARWN